MKKYFIFLFLLGISNVVIGQQVAINNIISPEILPDNQVIFRYFNPNAQSVTIQGNWHESIFPNQFPMTKDSTGLWSVKTAPFPAELWVYHFVVDGNAITLDPRNAHVIRDGIRYRNYFITKGETSANYEVKNVPHGSLHISWYNALSLNLTRRVYVYTPAGYETSKEKYPVLYLLHGGGGDEDAWQSNGRALQILDNLIASARCKPMIVVMANGNARQMAAQDYADTAPALGPNGETSAYPKSLVHELIPFIDQHFRTKADAANRAIAGLSMGGAQTFYAAFNYIDKFSYVGSFSGGFTLLPSVATPIAAPANATSLRGPDLTRSIDPDKFKALLPQLNQDVNNKLKLLYLAIGTSDALITTHNRVKSILDEKSIRYILVETPNYAHEWSYWRICLQDFLQKIF